MSMTDTEFNARALGTRARHDRDAQQAIAHRVLLDRGVRIADPHPLAEDLSDVPFPALTRGWGSSDFGTLMTAAASELISIQYPDVSHRLLMAERPRADFKAATFPTVDLGLLSDDPIAEQQGAPLAKFSYTAGETGTLKSYGATFQISDKALQNGEAIDLLIDVVRQLRQAYVRLEGRLLASAIEANANLTDGSAWFSGNSTLASSSLSVTGLNAAANLLRVQDAGGGTKLGAAIRYVVVPPELEYTAHTLISALSPSANITVVVLPDLTTATSFYCMADPAIAPVVARLTLRGTDGEPVVEAARREARHSGQPFTAYHDVGVAVLSRTGVVRVTA